MHKNIAAIVAAVFAAFTFSLTACNDSSSPTTATAPSSTTTRIKQDLKATGQDIKNVGNDIARKADPAIERAKENAEGTLHSAAEKVAGMTSSTQPATSTMPTPP